MKKLELKFDARTLQKATENTSWQKAVFGTLILSLLAFAAATAYLYFRPIPNSIKQEVDVAVQNQQINFNFKLLDQLKARETPNTPIESPSGKNPFVPF